MDTAFEHAAGFKFPRIEKVFAYNAAMRQNGAKTSPKGGQAVKNMPKICAHVLEIIMGANTFLQLNAIACSSRNTVQLLR